MLTAGTQLGPYEILTPLGAGGMGEVYRARDARLGREVAIKVLPAAYAADAERLRRFEQEARAAGMLNHPNILAIYDIGTHDGSPYLVSELLEGETLRERLRGGALVPRKATDYALQAARGLGAAHEKGITHRDLKPENLFLTKDGRVKILDFGLAKLAQSAPADSDETVAEAVQARTEPGVVLGTAGYMSPEQVRGQAADHRSDIFSFGAILYEMLSGERAFQGASAVETMNSILKEEPPDLAAKNSSVSPALDRIVRHCLEKSPEERFRSAHDLAFDLESLAGLSGSGAAAALPATPAKRRFARLAVELALAAAIAVAYFAGRNAPAPPPSFQRLTFQRGTVQAARFTPDGQTIVYAASWDGGPIELFSTRPGSPESRSLGMPAGGVFAIASAGETAICLGCRFARGFGSVGTLAQAPLAGGAPREILEDVGEADWSPDGKEMAVVRGLAEGRRLEFPIGKVLYQPAGTGWVSHPRISPKGDLIGFIDHPFFGDDGAVAVVDLAGKKKTLASGFTSAQGLAWSANGDEIWFTATRSGAARALRAVTLSGRERLVARTAGTLTLEDIARDGRVLLAHENLRAGIQGLPPGETKERDLSWLDWSIVSDLSDDGTSILFGESGEGSGGNYGVYLRKTDGSPAVRLGDGSPAKLSPDGKWALSIQRHGPESQLILLPTRAGKPQPLDRGTIVEDRGASWFADGKRIALIGREAGHDWRTYVQDIEGGKPRPITPEGTQGALATPDGRFLAARDRDQRALLYPIDGGEPRPALGAAPRDFPIRWSPDGRFLYVYQPGETPAKVFRMEVSTGRRELWKQIMPSDPAGVRAFLTFALSADGKSYAYSYLRVLSDLYLVEGLR